MLAHSTSLRTGKNHDGTVASMHATGNLHAIAHGDTFAKIKATSKTCIVERLRSTKLGRAVNLTVPPSNWGGHGKLAPVVAAKVGKVPTVPMVPQ